LHVIGISALRLWEIMKSLICVRMLLEDRVDQAGFLVGGETRAGEAPGQETSENPVSKAAASRHIRKRGRGYALSMTNFLSLLEGREMVCFSLATCFTCFPEESAFCRVSYAWNLATPRRTFEYSGRISAPGWFWFTACISPQGEPVSYQVSRYYGMICAGSRRHGAGG
jgi:hypothetical protein